MIEYERKYLVELDSTKLNDLLPYIVEKKRIIQGYLSTDPERVVRVRRIINDKSFITIKGLKTEGSCLEIEFPIMPVQADNLIKMCPKLITKTRYDLLIEGQKFELDVFEDELAGLVIVELEGNKEDIQQYIDDVGLPSWVGPDVTDDKFFSNVCLLTKTWPTVESHIFDIYKGINA